ncbi:MAG: tetratricopeptide repeat protein [Verrucomicrobiales bacterium]|nr:tetratricopeptide repeat protein [Verrucomicrobiales bacterium]
MKHWRYGMVLGLALLAGAMTGCSKSAKAARHLERADTYYAAGERDKAEIEYLNVLRLRSMDPHAIERLGSIYYDQGRFVQALAFLLKTREQNSTNVEARLRAAQILIVLNHPKEAREEALIILDQHPGHEDAMLILVESPRSTNELAEIQQRLDEWRPKIGSQAGYHLGQAVLALQRRDTNTAASASLEAIRLNPKSSAAQLVRAGYLLSQNDRTNALLAFQAAADLAPVRSLVRLRNAEFRLQLGDRAEARNLVSNLLAQASDYIPAQVQMFKMDLAEGKLDESEAMVGKVLTREPTNPEALLARVQVLLARGQRETALKEMERVVGLYPKSALVQYNHALTQLLNGDVTKATSALTQALAIEPNYTDAILLLARLNIRRGDTAAAITALSEVVRRRPNLVPAQVALAEAHALKGERDQALALYQHLAKNFPQDPQFPFLAGLVLRDQQKPADAYRAFEQALALAPNRLSVIQQMVDVRVANKEFEGARKLLEGPLAKEPTNAAPRVLLAATYLAERDLAKAEETLERAIELDPDARPAYMMLAQVYVATGKQQQALERLDRVVAQNPKDVQALMQIGMLKDSQQQYDAAADAYRKALEVNSRFAPALNNLAYLYGEHLNRLDEAFELAKRAREIAPNDPFSADTLGWIAFKRGDYAWALTLLEESGKLFPTEPEVQYHLGMAYYMLGQETAARQAFERALQSPKEYRGKTEVEGALAMLGIDPATADAARVAILEHRVKTVPADPVAARRLAAVYERTGEPARAVTLYEDVLKSNPKAAFAHLRLAELYATALKNPTKALEYARAARNLDPDDALVARAAGRAALLAGDAKWALSLLQESARRLPGDAGAQYDLALAAYQMGRVEEAEGGLQAALQVTPPFAQAESAQRWLEFLHATKDPARAVAASAKAAAALQADAGLIPAAMVVALAKEMQGDMAGARQGYEALLARYPEFAPATRQLALLFARQGGEDNRAQQLATRAREAYPSDPDVAAALGTVAYRRGDFARAVQLLRESSQVKTQDAEVQFYLGMAHYRLKQNRESQTAIQKAISLRLRAELLPEAERVLKELESTR